MRLAVCGKSGEQSHVCTPQLKASFFLATRTGEFNCSTCGYKFVTRQEWEQAKTALEQQIRTYQDLAVCLARYQHQLEAIQQRLQWNATQQDADLLLAFEKDEHTLRERIALLTWITGFSEDDGPSRTLPS